MSSSPAKILVTSAVGLGFGVSAITVGSFSAFILPLSAAFGWARGDIAFALSIFNFVSLLCYPILGALADRLSPRTILIPAILSFGFMLFVLSFMEGALWQLYLGYGLLAVAAVGTNSITYARLIIPWFMKRRGLALGIAFSTMGVSVAVLPPLVEAIAREIDWRAAYRILAVLVIVPVLPLVLAWASDPPAGKGAGAQQTEMGAGPTENMDWRELCSRNFVLLAVAFVLLGLLTGAIPSHTVPLLVENGVAVQDAAIIASSLGIALIAGRVITGYLLDRIFAPFLILAAVMLAVVGLLIIMSGASGIALMAIAIGLIGFTIGADGDFLSYLISRYVRLETFSRAYSLLVASYSIGMAIGPSVMGISANLTGTYDLALQILIASLVLALIPFFLLGPYPKDDASPSGITRAGA